MRSRIGDRLDIYRVTGVPRRWGFRALVRLSGWDEPLSATTVELVRAVDFPSRSMGVPQRRSWTSEPGIEFTIKDLHV